MKNQPNIKIEERQFSDTIHSPDGKVAARAIHPEKLMKITGLLTLEEVSTVKAICIGGIWYERSMFQQKVESEWGKE